MQSSPSPPSIYLFISLRLFHLINKIYRSHISLSLSNIEFMHYINIGNLLVMRKFLQMKVFYSI